MLNNRFKTYKAEIHNYNFKIFIKNFTHLHPDHFVNPKSNQAPTERVSPPNNDQEDLLNNNNLQEDKLQSRRKKKYKIDDF